MRQGGSPTTPRTRRCSHHWRVHGSDHVYRRESGTRGSASTRPTTNMCHLLPHQRRNFSLPTTNRRNRRVCPKRPFGWNNRRKSPGPFSNPFRLSDLLNRQAVKSISTRFGCSSIKYSFNYPMHQHAPYTSSRISSTPTCPTLQIPTTPDSTISNHWSIPDWLYRHIYYLSSISDVR
jgi:hypothetical protein